MKFSFKNILLALALLTGSVSAANAQSACKYITQGAVLTAAQWNWCFQQKNDTLGFTPLPASGGTMSGPLVLAPPSTFAGLNFQLGTPTNPKNGDFWLDSTGLNFQLSGSTFGHQNTPFYTGASAPGTPRPYSLWNNTAGSTIPLSIYDGSQWVNIGTLNPSTHTWTAGTGGSVTSFSAGTTGLLPSSASTGAITLSGTLAASNGGTGITSLGSGIPIWLGTPSSANLRAALTDETGSGAAFFAGGNAGVFSGISLALGGATIGSDALGVTGSVTISSTLASGAHTVTSNSATAFAAGLAGATNPAFSVDASTASSATGIKIKSAAAAGGAAISVTSSGTNENLTVDAKGSGTVTIAGTSTGGIVLSRSTTLGTITGTANNCLQANASGVITGTGQACAAGISPQITTLNSGTGATYTTPVGASYLIVTIKAGGGGGGPSGSGTIVQAGTGGTSTFNSINAAGGAGATTGGGGAVGTGGTGGTGTTNVVKRVPGAPGQLAGIVIWSSTNFLTGGASGGGPGAGWGRADQGGGAAGVNAVANSGSGGGGAQSGNSSQAGLSALVNGHGGGEGETAILLITSPAASYTYTVGAGGAGATVTSGSGGGAGGSGQITVEAH